MRCYLVVFLLACCCCKSAEPVLVVLERNPWLMVIGSDSPTFALYDDGTVIWQRDKATKEEPFFRGVTPSAHAALKEVLPYELTKFADHYELTSWSDQPTTVIWTPKKTISIYGGWRKTTSDSLPAEIRTSLLRIDEQRKIAGDVWFPGQIEVMFWPYEYAEESIVWPKAWPGLNAKSTVKRGDDSYSVFLPSDRLPELRQFLAKRDQKGAVLVDGKKMAVSLRFPFPKEDLWMRK